MGKINVRQENNNLYFDFRFHNKRCREQTTLPNTPKNMKRLKDILAKIEAEITLGTFVYSTYFPSSKRVREFETLEKQSLLGSDCATPTFADFAEEWFIEKEVEWRATNITTVRQIIDKHLNPTFGEYRLNEITRRDLFSFRTNLSQVPGRKGKTLSPSRINHVMNPLRCILREGASRYNFITPYQNIKALKVAKTDVQPFTLHEVDRIIKRIRPDYKSYITVRFFTGMRSSELHGLLWENVDFNHKQILIHHALVNNELIEVKNDGSYREIEMSTPVYKALREQYKATGHLEYVYSTTKGTPLSATNFTKRVWYPLLRHLDLKKRRPYHTRHTAATLWLASGESPEWIARQMGHSTTTMLFRVYSRFVPNLTRNDGSAFESLLKQTLGEEL